MLKPILEKFKVIFKNLIEPKNLSDKNSIEWVKNKVLNTIFAICMTLGFAVLIISLIAEYNLEKYTIIALAFVAYSVLASTILLKKSLNTKVYALIYVNYSIGLAHFIFSTPELGYLWMALNPILAAVFFGKKQANIFVALNITIPLLLFLMYDFDIVSYNWMYEGYNTLFNYATLSSVLLVNYLLVILITNILEALKRTIDEKDRVNLKLNNTNEDLENELILKNKKLKLALINLEETNLSLTGALSKSQESALLQKQFISMISHEYRTPLTIIQNNTEILKLLFNRDEKNAYDKSIKSIESAIQQKVSLIDKILTLQETNKSEKENINSEINLNSDLKKIIEELGYDEDYNIEYDLEDIIYKLNYNSFKQIVNNIIDNSIKFSDDPKIKLKVAEQDDGVLIVFEDNGSGMNKHEIENAFKPFYKGKKAETLAGSGVGLAIVKSNVAKIGGTIEITSEENVGTQVAIKLPKSNISNTLNV